MSQPVSTFSFTLLIANMRQNQGFIVKEINGSCSHMCEAMSEDRGMMNEYALGDARTKGLQAGDVI